MRSLLRPFFAASAAAVTAAAEEASAFLQPRPSRDAGVTASVVGSEDVAQPLVAREQWKPACPNMKRRSVSTQLQPIGSGLPVDSDGKLEVYMCCSDDSKPAVEMRVVLFLHGASGTADTYAKMYPEKVGVPWTYLDICFLQSPRAKAEDSSSRWMHNINPVPNLDHHWDNDEVMDNMNYLSQVVDSFAGRYGGYDKVWIAGYSQGAVMSSLVALKGTPEVLGGAFIVAGYPPRPLYTDDGGAKELPSDWTSEQKLAKQGTQMYFYTGEYDGVLPIDKSFCRYNRVAARYGLSASRMRFWSKKGYCHYDGEGKPGGGECHNPISAGDGSEFDALWHIMSSQPDRVEGVTVIQPDKTCQA